MKFLEAWDLELLNKAFDRIYRRVVALEQASLKDLDRVAPSSPDPGAMWIDIENGKFNIYDGSSWITFSKD